MAVFDTAPMTTEPARITRCILATLALAGAGLVLAAVIPAWFRFHLHMPWQDTLALLRGLQPLMDSGPEPARLWHLIEPHYTAHRVLLPRLLLLADTEFLGARSHLMYASGFLGLALVGGCHLQLARQSATRGGLVPLVAGLCICYLLAPSQLWNLLNPVNASWALSLGLALLAFFALLRRKEPPGTAALATSALTALLAAFSNFAGLLVWLLLPVALAARRHRYAAWSILPCALVVVLYLHGVHTDATGAIAMAKAAPDNAALQSFAEDAQLLQANNDALRVFANSVHTLGWPLGSDHPQLATGLVLLSFLVLGFAWIRNGIDWWRRATQVRPWTEFSMLGASLCLGVAICTHIGRVLPYPEVEHAASAARYQTYVLVYWLCISMLVLASLDASRHRFGDLPAAGLLVLAGLLVIVPAPGYLDRELRSLEYAAMLYTVGERGAARGAGQAPGLALTSDAVLVFEPYFAARRLAWHAELPTVPGARDLPDCAALGLQLSPAGAAPRPLFAATVERGERGIKATMSRWRSAITREILLFDDAGGFAARLYPHYAGGFPAWPWSPSVAPGWLGAVLPGTRVTTARVIGIPGAGAECRLPGWPVASDTRRAGP